MLAASEEEEPAPLDSPAAEADALDEEPAEEDEPTSDMTASKKVASRARIEARLRGA